MREPPSPRFIPAGAGNTESGRGKPLNESVHPRRRGEHVSIVTRPVARIGSSPQARGTHQAVRVVHEGSRFIPAGAGNTCCPSLATAALSVHPRRRGEHRPGGLRNAHSLGSSPQARGTPIQVRRMRRSSRFIPAGAGNTSSRVRLSPSATVHPRRRGEHNPGTPFTPSGSGSSPQARGTPLVVWLWLGGLGFIPAGAGNTHG